MALCSGMMAPSIPEGWLSVAGQMAQQSPEYSHLGYEKSERSDSDDYRNLRLQR